MVEDECPEAAWATLWSFIPTHKVNEGKALCSGMSMKIKAIDVAKAHGAN